MLDLPDVNPVAFELGPLTLHWYSLMLLTGAGAGLFLARTLAAYRGFDPDILVDVLLWGGAAALIGARAWYVAFKWQDIYRHAPWEALYPWRGGLAIHGGVLAGVVACAFIARRRNLGLATLLDLASPGLLLGQVIGRWGNWFNQEAYGVPALAPASWPDFLKDPTGHLAWGLPIEAVRRVTPYDDLIVWPLSTRFHPTFLYESLWDLAGLLGVLHVAFRHRPPAGAVACLYLLTWGSGRAWIEGLRADALLLPLPGGSLRIAQAASILMAGAATLVLAWLLRRNTRVSSVEEHS
ncbi:MAG: prolipoprotein diacylglyceryl transferase [Candidatus Sericytochromatia bacterium]|nr:prolipoprotein diacylglyceryl transferase [Candidatus Sericytochromatia bacterium]